MLFLHESVTMPNLTSIIFASAGIYLLRKRLGLIEERPIPSKTNLEKALLKHYANHAKPLVVVPHLPHHFTFLLILTNSNPEEKMIERYTTDTMILGKKVRTIKKKENSTECISWENNTKTCAIYKNRPFDRMMYPFDIFRINEKYHWVVYSCNPKSN